MNDLSSEPSISSRTNSWFSLLLLAGAFIILLLFGLRTLSGADIWFHLAAGRHLLQHGVASVDPFSFGLPPDTIWRQTTWLYDGMVLQLMRVGGSALTLMVHVAAVVAAFILVLPVARRYGNETHAALALLICAWMLAPLFTPRPELFCLLFVAIHLRILSQPVRSVAAMTLLAITQLIWVNMHLTFGLGLLMAAIAIWEARSTKQPLARHFLVFAGLMLVSGINPFGLHIFREAVTAALRPEGVVVLEWISLFYREFLTPRSMGVNTLALVLIAVVFIFRRERLPALVTALAIIGAYLMVRSNHALDLCALLIFPFITMGIAQLDILLTRLTSAAAARRIKHVGAMAFLMVLIASAGVIITNRYYIHIGSASSFGLGITRDVYPFFITDTVAKKHPLPARMINIAHDGGFLLCQQPSQKVFTDPRGSLYGGPFFERMAKGLRGNKENWSAIMQQVDPEGVLLNLTWSGAGDVITHLLRSEQWVTAYTDGGYALLVRKTSANRGMIEDEELKKQGLLLIEQDLQAYLNQLDQSWMRPPVPARLIGAATLFQTLGIFEESQKILAALNRGAPRYATAWINRGVAEFYLQRYPESIASLEQAATLLPHHTIVWIWLSKAYKAAGRDTDAARAASHIRGVNPTLIDRYDLTNLFPAVSTTTTSP